MLRHSLILLLFLVTVFKVNATEEETQKKKKELIPNMVTKYVFATQILPFLDHKSQHQFRLTSSFYFDNHLEMYKLAQIAKKHQILMKKISLLANNSDANIPLYLKIVDDAKYMYFKYYLTDEGTQQGRSWSFDRELDSTQERWFNNNFDLTKYNTNKDFFLGILNDGELQFKENELIEEEQVQIADFKVYDWVMIKSNFEADVVYFDGPRYTSKFQNVHSEDFDNHFQVKEVREDGKLMRIAKISDSCDITTKMRPEDIWITEKNIQNIQKIKSVFNVLKVKSRGGIYTLEFGPWKRCSSNSWSQSHEVKRIFETNNQQDIEIIFKPTTNEIIVFFQKERVATLKNPVSWDMEIDLDTAGFYFKRM